MDERKRGITAAQAGAEAAGNREVIDWEKTLQVFLAAHEELRVFIENYRGEILKKAQLMWKINRGAQTAVQIFGAAVEAIERAKVDTENVYTRYCQIMSGQQVKPYPEREFRSLRDSRYMSAMWNFAEIVRRGFDVGVMVAQVNKDGSVVPGTKPEQIAAITQYGFLVFQGKESKKRGKYNPHNFVRVTNG